MEKKQLTDEVLNEVYSTFKIEMKLEDGLIPEDNYTYSPDPKSFPTITWVSVGNLHGVNKLKSDNELSVSEGMTVVYGENGSGKSGYTRLLNNAFVSRGDQEILPNIYSEHPEEVSADFKFCVDGRSVEYKYPKDKSEYPFKTIRNFDSKSASNDMNKESVIDFAPSELSFFDLLLSACMEIQKKLDDEQCAKKIDNPILKYFPTEGIALNQMRNLSSNTSIDKLKEDFAVTDEERKRYEQVKIEKANLVALDINKQISLINQVIDLLSESIEKYNLFKEIVSDDNIDIYNQQIVFLNKCRMMHDKDGMKIFENEDIELVGTEEWKNFISTAKIYYDRIEQHDKCPLCGHKIEENDLIFKYWKYLESDAENNLKFAKDTIRISKERIQELDLSFLPKSSVQEQWLLDNFKKETQVISGLFSQANLFRDKLICAFEQERIIKDDSTIQIPDIQGLVTKVIAKRKSLNQESITIRIAECTKMEEEYVDKAKVNELLPIISSYIDYLKWDSIVQKSKIKTRLITNKQKELFEKYVTDDYLSVFKTECKKLNADFDIDIVSRGSSGQTLKKLQIKGKLPGKVLSEGEQRAISIANFLTEVQMDARNIGVVLDDPVCSLDHKRRSHIVNRLLDEAKQRQVVIFTHEITFFMELKTEAARNGVVFKQEMIRNISNEPGNISSTIPWQGMNVKERTGKLKNDLQGIIKVFNSGDMDKYYYKAKEWCELLRESWERAVEEVLLNDAIQRYNPCVQTQRLKKAPFTQELYIELERGMTECSAWCHDQARAMNGGAPSADDLKGYIKCFEEYWKQYKPN